MHNYLKIPVIKILDRRSNMTWISGEIWLNWSNRTKLSTENACSYSVSPFRNRQLTGCSVGLKNQGTLKGASWESDALSAFIIHITNFRRHPDYPKSQTIFIPSTKQVSNFYTFSLTFGLFYHLLSWANGLGRLSSDQIDIFYWDS